MKPNRFIVLAALLAVFGFLMVSAGDAQAGKYQRKSQEHEDACNAWCNEHPDICSHCSKKLNCGKGYETIKSWTGYGKNWYACKSRPSRDERSAQNEANCRAYCGRNPDCAKCARKCGAGYKIMRKWSGRGDNWKACTKKRYVSAASNWNRDECLKWCDENRDLCYRCSTNKRCGVDLAAVRSWKGKGRNWHACAWRSTIKARNQADCEAYCAEHPDECVECKTNKGCGGGLTAMKSFRLGKSSLLDYHACKERTSGGGELRAPE